MDAAIAQMVAFTDATPDRARQYLQVTDGDVEQAVSLFFESGGVDLGGPTPVVTESSTTAVGSGNARDPISIDDEEDVPVGRSTIPAAGMEDDEAMARRLQEEMYGGAGEEEVIRAPIARQAETLAGPGASDYYGGSSLDDAVQERLQAFSNRRGNFCHFTPDTRSYANGLGARRAPGIFNQQPTSRIWQEGAADRSALAESTGGASETNSRAQHLARLFAPNWGLMFNGSWDDARDEGKAEKKWLIVNIQNEKVFDCQVLNRDIWKDPSIVETVTENFLFLQYSKDDPRADQYCQYYFHNSEVEDEYPHVAIVDPRTGEQVKLWSRKIPNAGEFLMQLHEFLDRYSLDNTARNPVAKRRSEAKKEKPLDMLTEEEQMERALQASMAGQGSLKVPDEDPDELTRSVGDLKGKDVAMVETEQTQTNGSAAPSLWAQIPSDKPHEEPAANAAETTRIQIRHPEGRIVRRFALKDKVQRIFEYLKASPIEGREGIEFDVVAMGTNLMNVRDQTIEEAGLKNASVMVEFSES